MTQDHPTDQRGNDSDEEHKTEEDVSSAVEESIDDGDKRLHRSWTALLATGLVGGFDIGVGVLARYVVEDATGSEMLGSLAFTIGFVALLLAHSELFTENFLVPVTAVLAGRGSLIDLLRLWVGTLVMNLVGGWFMTSFIVIALPKLNKTVLEIGSHVGERSIGWEAFVSAVLAGSTLTLMTWMARGTESVPGKIAAAVSMSFLLAAGPLLHAIAGSLEMFGALHVGAPFGYAKWLQVLGVATAGNLVGGLGLVTTFRMAQVGRRKLREEKQYSEHRPESEKQ